MSSPTRTPLSYAQSTPGGIPLIHRDLSWLQFNERVLDEAVDRGNPLLERLKFLSITSSNLDEFFMIRYASLYRQLSLFKRQKNPQAKALQAIHDTILEEVGPFQRRQVKVLDEVGSHLAPRGITLSGKLGAAARKVFDEKVFPHLGTPTPFHFRDFTSIGNLQLCVFVPGQQMLIVPKSIPQAFLEEKQLFFLDELLEAFFADAFRLTGQVCVIRTTRDGDFTVDLEEEDTESVPDIVKSGIGRREKGRAVRIQVRAGYDASVLNRITTLLKVDMAQTFVVPRTLCLHALWSAMGQLPDSDKSDPALAYPPIQPRLPEPLRKKRETFEILSERDILLQHPYDTFDAFVSWIAAACADPAVTQIELTVYRTDAVSPITDLLKKNAKKKKIRVLIELRARFDELNNLKLAEELRSAGVEVGFGFGSLKLHAKIALVTRIENGVERRYTHLSTGNYNAVTARMYTDLAILTANPEIGQDARTFLDAIWKGQIPSSFKQLVVAPGRLHRKITGGIEAEIKAAQEGKKARIFAKVNALVDPAVIELLCRASSAGVKVDLVVRGACSLVPKSKGISDNIRVISVVDRYLEHSRIYYFESSGQIYLSSADWMPRNFFSRLEIAFPVLDPKIFAYLRDTLIPTYLFDTIKGRDLRADGLWYRRTQREGSVRSQFELQKMADKDYEGTALK